MKLTHASVFSGIGGPEIAATMLGWDNVFHCEINPFGRAVLDYWYPKALSYEDITKTDFSEWRGRVTVLTGGFPCQPFSYAGQRRGAEDDRYLWPHMFRCINQVQPDWVVAENVAGILTMVEQGEVSAMESQGALFDEGDVVRRYRLRETFTLQRICDDLEGHGYEVQPVLVPACAVGAPTVATASLSSDTVLLQTPTSVQTDEPPEKMRERAERNGYKNGTKFGSLTSQIKYDERVSDMLLPTPRSNQMNGCDLNNPSIAERNKSNLEEEVAKIVVDGFIPTPTAHCCNAGTAKEHPIVNRDTELNHWIARLVSDDGTPSRLSPLFTEEMMGFPFLWTTLPFLRQSGAPSPSRPTATP